MPAHLEAFLVALEAQDPREQPDRLTALNAAEKAAGKMISLDASVKRYPEFATRYRRWNERLLIGIRDAQIGRALAGKSSPAPLIAAMENDLAATTPNRGGSGGNGRSDGRPMLGRHHAGRKADFNRW